MPSGQRFIATITGSAHVVVWQHHCDDMGRMYIAYRAHPDDAIGPLWIMREEAK